MADYIKKMAPGLHRETKKWIAQKGVHAVINDAKSEMWSGNDYYTQLLALEVLSFISKNYPKYDPKKKWQNYLVAIG
jgi:hypothetical protein